jgi:O-antigen ligase
MINQKNELWNRYKREIKLFFSILAIILIISVLNDSLVARESYLGIYGRRFGFLSFLSIIFLSFVTYIVANAKSALFFSTTFIMTSLFVSVYFMAQSNGYDFAKWSESYGVPNSTLGNPNFLSAIAATSILCSLTTLVFVNGSTHKIISAINLPISGYMLYGAISTQGFAIVAIGLAFLLALLPQRFLPPHKRKKTFIALGVFTAVLLMMFASKLLEFIANEETLQRRFDYWRAGLRMIADRPLIGFGWDSFGTWYFRYRDAKAVAAGPGIFTDSPHNLFIEIGASSGLLVMTLYTLLLLMVLKSLFAQLFFSKGEDLDRRFLVPLSMVWMGMFLQSLVNPVSLPLTVWHFLSGAFLLGAQRDYSKVRFLKQDRFLNSTRSNQEIGLKALRRLHSGLSVNIQRLVIVLFVISSYFAGNSAFLAYRSDANVYKAVARGDGQALLVAVLEKDSDPELMKFAVRIFNDNSLKQYSLRVLYELTKRNPDDFYAWRLLFDTSATQIDRTRALIKMKELDPLNGDLATLKP